MQMFVNHTRKIDYYEGDKNWNQLALVERKELVELEFARKTGNLEEFMMTTGLKKAQYRGLRGLYIHALIALEKAGIVERENPKSKDEFKIIHYFEGTQFHDEVLKLLQNQGVEASNYDGVELEQFGFVQGNKEDPLDACFDMMPLEAHMYVKNLLQGSDPIPCKNQEGNSEKIGNDYADFKSLPFVRTSPNNLGVVAALFKYPFTCSEVKWVKQEIALFFDNNDAMARDLVMQEAFGEASNSDKVKYSIRVDRMTPKQIALIIIRNIAFWKLLSGHEHIYRGVLGIGGQDYLRLFRRAVGCGVVLGYTSPEEAEEELRELENEIKNVG
jgi:hypothetical protein